MQLQSLGQEDPLEEDPATHFLPEESQGQRSLVGYSPQGHKESDTAETTEYPHKLRSLPLPWAELSSREGHMLRVKISNHHYSLRSPSHPPRHGLVQGSY